MIQYFVYAYFDPTTMIPFYVGKGHGSRHLHHIRDVRRWIDRGQPKLKRGENYHKCHKIAKLLNDGIVPLVEKLFESPIEEEVLAKEKELVELYGRIDLKTGTLTNKTAGGTGAQTRTRSIETVNKIKQSRSAQGYLGSISSYEVVWPNGTVERVTGMRQFCKDHKLTYSRMAWIVDKPELYYRGFSVKLLSRNEKPKVQKPTVAKEPKFYKRTVYILTDSNGQHTEVTSMLAWCTEQNFEPRLFYAAASGRRSTACGYTVERIVHYVSRSY